MSFLDKLTQGLKIVNALAAIDIELKAAFPGSTLDPVLVKGCKIEGRVADLTIVPKVTK